METVHLELIYQGDHCPSCFYMAEAVEMVLPKYANMVRYTKLEFTKNRNHAKRFYELSISLYGFDEATKRLKCAPIPSLFINGKLAFDIIPPLHELEEAISKAILAMEPGRSACRKPNS